MSLSDFLDPTEVAAFVYEEETNNFASSNPDVVASCLYVDFWRSQWPLPKSFTCCYDQEMSGCGDGHFTTQVHEPHETHVEVSS